MMYFTWCVRVSVLLAIAASPVLAQEYAIQTIQHGGLRSKDPAQAFGRSVQAAPYINANAQMGLYPQATVYPPPGSFNWQPCQTGVRIPATFQRTWRPYVDLEVRGGSSREVGQGNLFVPLWQDPDSLLFADLRGQWTDVQSAEGNVGLAYRQILPSQWIVGVYGFYDFRHTRFNNNFHQATFGAELLNVNWGFRANGYIPDGHVGAVPGLNGAFLQGGNIVVRRGEERAYYGVDFEVEGLLWHSGWSGCTPGQSIDAEVWAAAGLFHFDSETPGFDDMTGPRLRAELRLYDLPLLGNDSRLVASAQYEHDDVRGSVATGTLAVRIPFGPGGGRSGTRLNPLGRRMVTPIVRDIDIITNVGLSTAEPAKFARTGQAISSALIVDGNTADPEGDIDFAGIDSLIIADGSAGTIMPTGTIDMPVGQVILGGGSGLAVIGCNTGTRVTFTAPGTRGTINGGDNDAVNAATDACIQGVNLETTGDGARGIVVNDDTNVLIDDVTITTSGGFAGGADGIGSSGTSQFTVNRSNINTSGESAIGIFSKDDSQFTVSGSTINTSGTAAHAIDSRANSQFTVSDTDITTNTGIGIISSEKSQFTVHGGSITTTDANADGVSALSSSGNTITFLLNGVTIDSGRRGVFVNGVGLSAGTINATITGSTITSGSQEIDAQTGGTATQCLNVFSNTLDGGAGTIRLLDLGTGGIDVTQGAPGSGAGGIDTLNGIPAANVTTSGTINFNAGPCPLP